MPAIITQNRLRAPGFYSNLLGRCASSFITNRANTSYVADQEAVPVRSNQVKAARSNAPDACLNGSLEIGLVLAFST